MILRVVCLLSVLLPFTSPVQASVGSKVVQEALEFATRKFGKEVAEEGIEQLSKRMTTLAARHGDDLVAMAYRKVGPRAGRLVSEVGEQQADTLLQLLARHGDEAIPFATRGSALQLVGRFGDDAADALVRHGAVGEQLIGTLGESGAKALTKVSPQNGRRLAMLAGDGVLKPELMEVICRHGDRACEFVFKNKGALAVGATLAAFVAAPEGFIDGTVAISSAVAEHVLEPLAELPKDLAVATMHRIPWELLLFLLFGLFGAVAIATMTNAASATALQTGWRLVCDRWQSWFSKPRL